MTENERRYNAAIHSQMSTCRACKAQIIWMKTVSGKNIPVNPKKVHVLASTGEMTLLDVDGNITRRPEKGTIGWEPHWSTCPKADEFRKPRP